MQLGEIDIVGAAEDVELRYGGVGVILGTVLVLVIVVVMVVVLSYHCSAKFPHSFDFMLTGTEAVMVALPVTPRQEHALE